MKSPTTPRMCIHCGKPRATLAIAVRHATMYLHEKCASEAARNEAHVAAVCTTLRAELKRMKKAVAKAEILVDAAVEAGLLKK